MKKILALSGLLFTMNMAVANNLESNNNVFNSISEIHKPKHGHDMLKVRDVHVFEVEEPTDLGFDTKAYLPEDFNPLKGKGDLDWSKIELIEIEEPVYFNFNVDDYLPQGFNPNK
ncbi:hypothetical protein ACW5R3_11465 [Bizionia sp. KMM 8389]